MTMTMTMKQKLATGFLAMLIVGSVALMPASAQHKRSGASMNSFTPSHASVIRAELPQDQVRDFTYN